MLPTAERVSKSLRSVALVSCRKELNTLPDDVLSFDLCRLFVLAYTEMLLVLVASDDRSCSSDAWTQFGEEADPIFSRKRSSLSFGIVVLINFAFGPRVLAFAIFEAVL